MLQKQRTCLNEKKEEIENYYKIEWKMLAHESQNDELMETCLEMRLYSRLNSIAFA